jgi:hypothetical protein
MCIFGETNSGDKSPDDILFINFSKIKDDDTKPNIDADRTSLFKEIFDMIKIDNMNDYNTTNRKGKEFGIVENENGVPNKHIA